MIHTDPFDRWSSVRSQAASAVASGTVVAFASGVDPGPAAAGGSATRGRSSPEA